MRLRLPLLVLLLDCAGALLLAVVERGKGTSTRVLPSEERPRDFLLGRGLGAYTVLRTVRRKLPGPEHLSFHVGRLWESSCARDNEPEAAEMLHLTTLRLLEESVLAWESSQSSARGEDEVILTCLWEEENGTVLRVLCHVCDAPPLASWPQSILVESRTAARPDAYKKRTEWLRQRKPLEALKSQDVGEVVMVSGSGQVLEGLVSNVFVVRNDGVVCTAGGSGVLHGSVRRLCLDACRQLGLTFDGSAELPIADLRSRWSEAFVTNAVSIVVPVSLWREETGGVYKLKSADRSSITNMLRGHILSEHFCN